MENYIYTFTPIFLRSEKGNVLPMILLVTGTNNHSIVNIETGIVYIRLLN